MTSPLHAAMDVLARLPSGWTEGLGERLGGALGTIVRYRRAEVLDAMARAFPDWSEEQRIATANRMYRNLGRTMGENVRLYCGRAEGFVEAVRLVGEDIVRDVMSRGRGALCLTAHFGNFELYATKAAAEGYPTNILAKEIKNRAANEFLTRAREQYGVRILPRQNSFRDCLRVLKRNELIGFMLDQNMIRTEGVFVDFLGSPACTSPGLAYLSAQSGAPVIPILCRRTPEGHVMEIRQPFDPPPDREPDTILEMTQRYVRVLEDAIRATPDQWIWIHRRWRTRPLAYAENGTTGARI